MNYRKEIDGLRALAVIPVILFHAGFPWFSGGFVGVDIFFVISGYLITSIIVREKQAGHFSIANFYERRARRILPALFFVLLVSLLPAWFLLLPHELIAFGKSIISVSSFSSNFLFWHESGYFAEDAEWIPLLHTWTLAVEEQFYLFFPLVILAFWRFRMRSLLIVISLIAIISFTATEWGWRNFPEANFYLIPTRTWELMVGALLAFYLYFKPMPQGKFSQAVSLFGLALIFYAIIFFNKDLPYPSVYTLFPVMGTALIILFTHADTWAYQFLSLRIMVFIGLISYSAYLWHWILFVFARLYTGDELNSSLAGLLSIIALLLAYFSWRFIERPFRNKQRFTQKQVFISSLIVSLIFISIGLLFILGDGFPQRFS